MSNEKITREIDTVISLSVYGDSFTEAVKGKYEPDFYKEIAKQAEGLLANSGYDVEIAVRQTGFTDDNKESVEKADVNRNDCRAEFDVRVCGEQTAYPDEAKDDGEIEIQLSRTFEEFGLKNDYMEIRVKETRSQSFEEAAEQRDSKEPDI